MGNRSRDSRFDKNARESTSIFGVWDLFVNKVHLWECHTCAYLACMFIQRGVSAFRNKYFSSHTHVHVGMLLRDNPTRQISIENQAFKFCFFCFKRTFENLKFQTTCKRYDNPTRHLSIENKARKFCFFQFEDLVFMLTFREPYENHS